LSSLSQSAAVVCMTSKTYKRSSWNGSHQMVSSVYVLFFGGFVGAWATQMQCKCTDSCSRPIYWSSNPWLLSLKLHMVIAQLFEVTVATDGSELSSKRVSKLFRRYHRHKKQLRQSVMMAEVSSDAWVCHKCSYESQDYQRCMG
jgi:hypothetical protein